MVLLCIGGKQFNIWETQKLDSDKLAPRNVSEDKS